MRIARKKIALFFGLLCFGVAIVLTVAQVTLVGPRQGPLYLGGLLYASNFGQFKVPPGTIGQYSWKNGSTCQPTMGGVTFNAFTVNVPVNIVDLDNSSNNETVTPSAVTITTASCAISIAPTHGHTNYYFTSASGGLYEAIQWALGTGAVYDVEVTPDFALLGGTTSTITSAAGSTNVSISDHRTAAIAAYTWSGSAYVATAPVSGPAGGDLSGTYPNPTVVGINGTSMAGLATGILKNTTTTGVPSIAVAGTDYIVPGGALGTPTSGLITNLTGTCSTCVANSATLSAPIASPTFTGTATVPLVVVSGNGAASASPLIATGTVETGGSATTNFPHFFIQPTGTTAVTSWSTNGTGLGMNLASGFAGNFIDVHTAGGTSLFSVNQNGAVTTNNAYLSNRADNAWFAATGNTTANFNFCNSGFANCLVYSTNTKALSISGQVSSSLATGTAPFAITSTTPVANLTVSNHPKVFNCATTTTCANTAQTGALIQFGTVALSGGTATVTTLTAYTGTTTFRCTASDNTTGTLGANAVPASTTSITVTGTASDTISYICVGN